MMYSDRTFTNRSAPTITRKNNGQAVQGFGATITRQDAFRTNVVYPAITSNPTGDICAGAEEHNSNRQYVNGDKVIFQKKLVRSD